MLAQRTIRNKTSASGVGLHTGVKATLTLHPADPNTGILFRRKEGNKVTEIPAQANFVGDTTLSTTLEHGGAAPVILDESADIDMLVPKLAKGGFYHSGQVCVSVQRVFMLGEQKAEIASKLGEYANNLIVGNAIHEKTECGPLIRNREVDRVERWITEARNGGAKGVAGGRKISHSCYAPTVLLNPPTEAEVSKNEIFGPVISLYESESLSEAISMCNSLPFAFQASIFSNNYSNIIQFFNNVDASAVMINDHTAFRVDWMPFAGRGQSGYGIGGIPFTMEDMTKIKMAVFSY